MGADTFIEIGTGTDVQVVFQELRTAAAYEYGHGGYTGSLAEKDSVIELPVAPFADQAAAVDYAQKLLGDWKGTDPNTALIDDKWGPAGAIRFGTDGWVIFGWASS